MRVLTWAGRCVALLAGATLIASPPGVFIYQVEPGTWLDRLFFVRFRVAAFTWGAAIIAQGRWATNEQVLRHESVHIRQAERYGIFLPLVYGWYSLVAVLKGGDAYEDNALEVEAREEERN